MGFSFGFALLAASATADKLHHSDGTVVEGKIVGEGPDDVRIETKYGTLTYEKVNLTKIERSSDGSKPATPTPTPANYTNLIPAGPIDPFAPPKIVPLVQLSPAQPVTTSGTATLQRPARPVAAPSPQTALPAPTKPQASPQI